MFATVKSWNVDVKMCYVTSIYALLRLTPLQAWGLNTGAEFLAVVATLCVTTSIPSFGPPQSCIERIWEGGGVAFLKYKAAGPWSWQWSPNTLYVLRVRSLDVDTNLTFHFLMLCTILHRMVFPVIIYILRNVSFYRCCVGDSGLTGCDAMLPGQCFPIFQRISWRRHCILSKLPEAVIWRNSFIS